MSLKRISEPSHTKAHGSDNHRVPHYPSYRTADALDCAVHLVASLPTMGGHAAVVGGLPLRRLCERAEQPKRSAAGHHLLDANPLRHLGVGGRRIGGDLPDRGCARRESSASDDDENFHDADIAAIDANRKGEYPRREVTHVP